MKSSPKKTTLHRPSIDIRIENEKEQMETEESSPSRDLQMYEQIGRINSSFKEQSDKLVQKLNEKSKEIENLCVLLESLSPIPGLEPEKLMKLIDGESTEVDFRDSKIVDLAKKCRKLQVALNKERANEIANQAKIRELTELLEQAALGSSISGKGNSSSNTASAEELESFQRDLAQANKQIEDLRRKLLASTEENKKLQRIVQKEVGEGAGAAVVSEEGWRGRAQQIVMLRAKVKRLEAEATLAENSQDKPHRRRMDVDSKAEQELADMQAERQRVLDGLLNEKARLAEECSRLKEKLDGSRARCQNLTEDGTKLRENIKVILYCCA